MGHVQQEHAVVIGGSVAGLLAARVLAGKFRCVTVLERDIFPAAPEPRKGVPQSRHTHGLLASGTRILERLLPGLSQQLVDEGALQGDILADARWFHEGACLARTASGLDGVLATRPLLEARVRDRVLALPNLSTRQGIRATGLTFSQDRRRVTGVVCPDGDIAADLVVDAGGRGSQSPGWLAAAGYLPPVEETVRVNLTYATRFFRRHAEDLAGDTAIIIPPTAQGKRGGVMLAQEGDRWSVTLIGHFDQVPPLDLSAFIEFARTLPASFIHQVVKDAEPLGEPQAMRFPESMRRRYERLDRFPEGYVVFGDALASFNPIYGQGMSVAALEAEVLAESLAGGTAGIGQRFFKGAAKVIDTPWTISVGNDLRMPETVGPRGPGVSFINWYISRLHRSAHSDPTLAVAFLRVANLLEPPASILRPAVAWRVLVGALAMGRPASANRPQAAVQDHAIN